jgi:hypothetical protein
VTSNRIVDAELIGTKPMNRLFGPADMNRAPQVDSSMSAIDSGEQYLTVMGHAQQRFGAQVINS